MPTIAPARTYALSGFQPIRVPGAGAGSLAFTIQPAVGRAADAYKRGRARTPGCT